RGMGSRGEEGSEGRAGAAVLAPQFARPHRRLSAAPPGLLLAVAGLLALVALVTTDWAWANGGARSALPQILAAALAGAAAALGVAVARRTSSAGSEAEQASLPRLMQALDGLPDGVAVWDSEDRLVAWSSAYAELFGDRRHDLLRPGISFASLVRGVAEAGLALEADADREGWIARRIEQHRAC